MSYYHRALPHWHPDGAFLFVTWRLFGSLPRTANGNSAVSPGRAFVLMDRQLDRAGFGPVWLRDTRIARSIVEALRFAQDELRLCELRSYVVMPNHVHVLLEPNVPLARVTKSIKGYTAREANKLLQRTGQPFWQYESYDRWVRNDAELQRIVRYIERNPVTAGFVRSPEDWPWSSAHVE
jgi:REP element-mobilizing transposase RayT